MRQIGEKVSMKHFIKNLILMTILLAAQNVFAQSLYDLKTNWRDIENKKTDVSVATGSYVLIAMVYTGCAHACPMTISKIKKIEEEFSKAKFTELKIVLASFDVKNDRPEKLKKYQAERKLNPDQWKFLAAETDDDARKLAVTLGISYKDIGDGDFSHSNAITLLDPSGNVLASINSLNADTAPLLTALQESLKKVTKK